MGQINEEEFDGTFKDYNNRGFELPTNVMRYDDFLDNTNLELRWPFYILLK